MKIKKLFKEFLHSSAFKPALLMIAAACLIISVSAGKAWAYFTTYATAQGGYILHLGDDSEIEEGFSDWTKRLAIKNDDKSDQPVYVRAKIFADDGIAWYTEQGQYSDGKIAGLDKENSPARDIVAGTWAELISSENGADDFTYFSGVLQPGQTAAPLNVRIDNIPDGTGVTDFNVIIVYETTPAQVDSVAADGTITYAEPDWNELLYTGSSN